MGKYSDNRGFSLIELVIGLALIMIVSGSIISFLIAGSSSYSSVVTTADLQKEAQLVMNQISDIVISADKQVDFVGSTNTLEVTNKDAKYEISYNPIDKKIYCKKSNWGIGTRTYEEQENEPMAENVTSFSADVVKEGGVSKVKVRINFENNSKSYTKEETITLRNDIN